jgi:transcriptional regulator with XRE-family HTH domain
MSDTIGQKLKAAREARHISIEKAAEATRIRSPYLQALENDDFSLMVSAAQGRGFLRLYVEFLGLDLDELTASARDTKSAAFLAPEADPAPVPEAAPATPTEEKPARPNFFARFFRRSAPAQAESTPAEEPAPAPAAPVDEPTAAVSAPLEEGEPVKPTKKTTRKKSAPDKKKLKSNPS